MSKRNAIALIITAHIALLGLGVGMACYGIFEDSWRWFLAGCLVTWVGWR